jgi:hypothetical protein
MRNVKDQVASPSAAPPRIQPLPAAGKVLQSVQRRRRLQLLGTVARSSFTLWKLFLSSYCAGLRQQ